MWDLLSTEVCVQTLITKICGHRGDPASGHSRCQWGDSLDPAHGNICNFGSKQSA